MSLRIRKIEYTADGRRIERLSDIDADRLTVGRASDNAIALPDLAVEPAHVSIALAGPGRLAVQALGSLGFVIDGRSTMQAAVELATGAELRLGAFRLRITRDGDGTPLIEVENIAAQRAAVDPAEDKRGFALARVMPSRRLMGWVSVVLIVLAFVALPVFTHLRTVPAGPAQPAHARGAVVNDAAWNPGPLSLAHRALTGKCEACHVRPFESVRNATCQACHKEAHDHAPAARLAAARGAPSPGMALRQGVAHAFGREGPGACTDCHVEHTGARPMDPPRQQFCADCHAGLKGRLPDTHLADAADFGTQHPQFAVTYVADAESRRFATASLDAHPREDNGLTFSHKIHLDPLGGVAKMAVTLKDAYGKPLDCAACHHRSADGVSFQPVAMERDCAACHSLAYARAGGTLLRLRHGDVAQMAADLARAGPLAPVTQGRSRPGEYAAGGLYHAGFDAGSAGLAGRALARDGVCGECHTPVRRGGQLGVRHVTLVQRYMANGWFDHAAHRQSACADCHAAKASTSAGDVLMPGIKACRDCHLGEGAAAPKVASGCAMCHAYHTGPLAPPADRKPGHDRLALTAPTGFDTSMAAKTAGEARADRTVDRHSHRF